jgi:8-oxo-dGTP diphosphatase
LLFIVCSIQPVKIRSCTSLLLVFFDSSTGTSRQTGGHLEFKEELEACVRREVQEETNLTVNNIHFGTITNDIFAHEEKHYITVFMVCDYANGELTIMEPEKCEEWKWFHWDEVPRPLFLPFENLLKKQFSPFAL